MKLSNIKSESDFYTIGNCWYQRALNMSDIWSNDNETETRKEKAFMIWQHYAKISTCFLTIANQIQINKHSKSTKAVYKNGRYNDYVKFEFTNESGKELIINNMKSLKFPKDHNYKFDYDPGSASYTVETRWMILKVKDSSREKDNFITRLQTVLNYLVDSNRANYVCKVTIGKYDKDYINGMSTVLIGIQ